MKKSYRILMVMLVIASLVLSGCGGAELPSREFSLGVVSGNTYTSEYAGVAIELGDEWQMLGAEDLQSLPGDIREQLKGSDAGKILESRDSVMDMQAGNLRTGSTVNVNYTLTKENERAGYARMSEEETLDEILKQYDTLVDVYAQVGVENAVIEKITVNFLGGEYPALRTTGQIQGVDIYFVQVQNYKLGIYGATITVTSLMEDTTQDVLERFYPVG